jgi:hypothetical protein
VRDWTRYTLPVKGGLNPVKSVFTGLDIRFLYIEDGRKPRKICYSIYWTRYTLPVQGELKPVKFVLIGFYTCIWTRKKSIYINIHWTRYPSRKLSND